MSWSFGSKSPDTGFAAELKRSFDEGKKSVAGFPASLRALDAIERFLAEAPLNIPQGCTVAFATQGHLDGDGRGELTVKVAIGNTPS
jgi:hypothetical protein